MSGLITVADINVPKSRSNASANPSYIYTAIAKDVAVKTTDDTGWAVYRTELATGNVDWAKKNGVPTKEYVFSGTDYHLLSFDE